MQNSSSPPHLESEIVADAGCEVNALAISPCQEFLYLGCQDYSVRILSLSRGVQLQVLKEHKYWVNDVSSSSDGTHICSASTDKTLKIWNVKTNPPTVVHTCIHLLCVAGVSFSGDGTRIASASWDQTVRVWEVATGGELLCLNGHADWVHSVSWSPDGQRLASASSDHNVRIWNMVSGEVEQVLVGHSQTVMSVRFCPDGKRLASGSLDRSMRIWNYVEGTLETRLLMDGESESIYTLCFIDENTVALGCKNKKVVVYDISKNERIDKFTGHGDVVACLCCSNKSIFSCSHDRTVRSWPRSRVIRDKTLPEARDSATSVSYQELQDRIRETDESNLFLRRELSAAKRALDHQQKIHDSTGRSSGVNRPSISSGSQASGQHLLDIRQMVNDLAESSQKQANALEPYDAELHATDSHHTTPQWVRDPYRRFCAIDHLTSREFTLSGLGLGFGNESAQCRTSEIGRTKLWCGRQVEKVKRRRKFIASRRSKCRDGHEMERLEGRQRAPSHKRIRHRNIDFSTLHCAPALH
eukprot:GEMP01031571.1.p1 GENE.GEMP01031571.1~~GEMP01031571.1.p1  ORF type:complete len:528 (+),score=59.29 GEMP01031571.1:18-1601(+)